MLGNNILGFVSKPHTALQVYIDFARMLYIVCNMLTNAQSAERKNYLHDMLVYN